MPGRLIPHRTPFFLPWIYPTLTWRIPGGRKEIYLTFDDGPIPGATDFVIDTLGQRNSKATFFCIGDNVRKHPDVFKRIVNCDHAVGNHTFNHLNGWRTDCDEYLRNIEACHQEMSRHLPVTSRWFRPPYGRITQRQIRYLHDYEIIMWDVLSGDYDQSQAPDTCLRKTIQAVRPGSIIVFHDSYKAEKNMMFALPRLLDHFLEKGFVFKLLP
ncbi:MAG: polysaccharide deacetylase family protein [Bacteroidota bacterium]